MAQKTKLEEAIEHIRQAGIVRPRDLQRLGIPQDYLWRLHKEGLLDRLGHGIYAMPDSDLTEHHSLGEVCKRVPHGVVCLLSALRFHGLTTQNPFEVWIAIDPKAREPKLKPLQLRVVRFSGRALTEGVEESLIEGVTV
ncbi:MAG: transcriptional regulator, partial [Planctomycetes bacterium]|nr:transcriptional regulator [Planctomycetota bacterium]